MGVRILAVVAATSIMFSIGCQANRSNRGGPRSADAGARDEIDGGGEPLPREDAGGPPLAGEDGGLVAIADAGHEPEVDAGHDGGHDAGSDAGHDGGHDAGRPSVDGGYDAGARDGLAPSSAGDVVITEIMWNPYLLPDDSAEWIELYNPTDRAWNLQGCELYDLGTDYDLIEGPLVVAPRTHVTLARGLTPGFTPTYVYDASFTLGNVDDEVGIRCDGIAIDEVTYGAFWPHPNGSSVALHPDSYSAALNDAYGEWCVSMSMFGSGDNGSPNAINPRCR